jgi:hypothetical protein
MEYKETKNIESLSVKQKTIIITLLIVVPVIILLYVVFILFFNYPVEIITPDQTAPQNIPVELVEPIEGAGRS